MHPGDHNAILELGSSESRTPMFDYYLVLTGPPSAAASSRGTTRPWCIQALFLFDARQLRSEQMMRRVIGLMTWRLPPRSVGHTALGGGLMNRIVKHSF